MIKMKLILQLDSIRHLGDGEITDIEWTEPFGVEVDVYPEIESMIKRYLDPGVDLLFVAFEPDVVNYRYYFSRSE